MFPLAMDKADVPRYTQCGYGKFSEEKTAKAIEVPSDAPPAPTS
jgi:hypothetical protein